ncbi:hypothetical protein [Streptococcus danieliae]|uniref:Uncharacterized protein n=1 Tax=Streptococcus danieliae TaxID=747656 RepID=A0A7Z0M698_9STRE|nr:hypothetical protein [Streptococcus danieliae]MBF0699494.1 hypothetical protein [Streptococcus danieliae]NYS96670.1 hypothetical protein [Streptococcus danieliae]
MNFPLLKKSRPLISDDLFLEISWLDGKSPEDDPELLRVIEELDQRYLEIFDHAIEERLPYLTFHQAEVLFSELREVYGQYQFKKVAIAHLKGKEVVTEGEVFASPLIIDSDYQNVLLPLIQSILTHPDFEDYSYQEKREYFENQIYPVYKQSLDLLDSSLPIFPVEGEEVSRVPVQPITEQPSSVAESTIPSLKKVYLLLSILGLLAGTGFGLSAWTMSHLSQKTEQLNYLYKELKDLKTTLSTENEVDVFSRYFLTSYYSGNKEVLVDFLSDGDAKYTAPQEGRLQSVLLEKIDYDSDKDEYEVTYVLSLKQEDKLTSLRQTFSIQKKDSAKYGYIIVREPRETEYLKSEE